jgi:hypothetical protein
VQVIVSVTGFQGEFEAWLQLSDLTADEADAMYRSIGQTGTAVLQSAEPDIHLSLRMNTLGQISATYMLESERPDGQPTALSGGFSMDQSYLLDLVRSTRLLITELASPTTR